jgi:hypothetical protein
MTAQTMPEARNVAAEVGAWLDQGRRSGRQWNGLVGSEVAAVLEARGWQRSRADEGYSNLSYQAFRHPTEPGQVQVTEACFFGAFTIVERLGG